MFAFRRWLLATLISLPTVAAAQGASPGSAPPVLTLEAAIAAAIVGNRQVQSSTLGVAKSVDAIAEARTARLPQFDAKFLGGIALTPIDFTIPKGALGTYSIGPLPATDSSIETPRQFTGVFQASISQPVSQLFKIGLAVRQAEVGHDLAGEGLRAERQEIVRQVRVAYAELAQLQSQIDGAEAALTSLTELSALTGRRLAEQAVLASDNLSVKARVSQQAYRLLTLRDTLDSDREAFNRLLGRDVNDRFVVNPLPPPPTTDETSLQDAERLAVERRPELKEARLQVSKADLDVRRTHAERLPDVSVQLSYLSFPNVTFLPTSIAHVGVYVDWQPFDWGQRRRRVAELTLTEQQAALTATDAEAQVRTDARATYRRLAEARALVVATTLASDTDRERLRVLMNRYQENASLLADVLQAQAALADSDAQRQQALAGFWSAKANFDRAVGENN